MAIAYYVLDLETNGLKYGFHEICELSVLRASDRVQMTRQVKVDNPENSSFDALRITGKTMNDLTIGVSKDQLIKDFENFIGEDNLTPAHRCLVGHNIISFDRKFLLELWESKRKVFPFDLYLDTLHMAKFRVKQAGSSYQKPKLNLGAACDFFDVRKVSGQHNAKSDTQNCFLLWEQLMKTGDFLDLIKRMPQGQEDNE